MQRPRRRGRRQLDTIVLRQELAIPRGELVAPVDPGVEPVKLREPQSALEVRDPVVEAKGLHRHVPVALVRAGVESLLHEPVRSEHPHPSRQLVVLGGHQAALAGGHRLDRVKGEARDVGAARAAHRRAVHAERRARGRRPRSRPRGRGSHRGRSGRPGAPRSDTGTTRPRRSDTAAAAAAACRDSRWPGRCRRSGGARPCRARSSPTRRTSAAVRAIRRPASSPAANDGAVQRGGAAREGHRVPCTKVARHRLLEGLDGRALGDQLGAERAATASTSSSLMCCRPYGRKVRSREGR